jgi:hypothetical protein
MDVRIKSFTVEQAIKTNGLELEVKDPNGGQHRGDCYVTMTGLTWCEGRTRRENGVKLSWAELEDILASDAARKAALKSARAH